MKQSKIFFIASILFYAAFIIGFVAGVNRTYCIVWLCLGCSNLALGKKQKKKEDDSSNEKPQQ